MEVSVHRKIGRPTWSYQKHQGERSTERSTNIAENDAPTPNMENAEEDVGG